MKISGAMPIHNEAEYLPYTLNALDHAPIYELVCVLDFCTDQSEQIIRKWAERQPFQVKILKKEWRHWINPNAEVFFYAMSNCSGDMVYSLAGDCVYDQHIFDPELWEDSDVLSFEYFGLSLNGPLRINVYENYVNFFRRYGNLARLWSPAALRSGIYAFKRKIWENGITIRDVPGEDTDFLSRMMKHYRHRYVKNMKNFHMRTASNPAKQFQQGVGRAKLGRPLWHVLAHSVLLFKPQTIVGYIQTRWG